MSDDPRELLKTHREFIELQPEQVEKILLEAEEASSNTTIWTKNPNHLVHTRTYAYKVGPGVFSLYIPKDFDADGFAAEVAQLDSEDCYFNVLAPTASLFFKSQIKEITKVSIDFEKPKKVLKIQRRKYERLMLSTQKSNPVVMAHPIFPSGKITREMLDISGGGIAVKVPEEEEILFQPGMNIKKVDFKFLDSEIHASVQVRYSRALFEKGHIVGSKIGLEFVYIDDVDRERIKDFVARMNRDVIADTMG